MIALYLTGLAAGGILLSLSLAGGGGDGAHEGGGDDVDADSGDADEVDVEVEADVEGGESADGARGGAPSGAIALSALAAAAFPFASLRYWTFFLAFGGLAGALLTWLSPLGAAPIAAVAGAVGHAAGVGAGAIVRWAVRDQVTSTVGADACLGASAVVLLPIARGARGRIRVALDSRVVDFDAETDDEAALAVAEPVVVYAMRDDGVVLVTSAGLRPYKQLAAIEGETS